MSVLRWKSWKTYLKPSLKYKLDKKGIFCEV